MSNILLNSLDQGLITAFMALGVLITFTLMGFPDMTVEGSYMLGGTITAAALVMGLDPVMATAVGAISGALAGLCTGLMHTKLGINAIVAGLLTTSAAFTVALVVMGRPNASLLKVSTLYESTISTLGLPPTSWTRVGITAVLITLVGVILFWFLNTDLGITIRAVGSNEKMIRALAVDTDKTKILAMMISNAMVALGGSLATQAQGFADVNMGLGALVAAFASIVVGRAIFKSSRLGVWIASIIVGAVAYRALLNIALRTGLPPDYFKAMTAVLVLLALWAPDFMDGRRNRRLLAREAKRKSVQGAALSSSK